MKRYFIHPDWHDTFKKNGLDSFDKLWAMQNPLVDSPNLSKHGFSQVSKIDLLLANGESAAVYLKKQINYTTKTILHPLKGIPTTRRELKNIIRFNKAKIDTLTPIFYAEQKLEKGLGAILITKALDNYISLKEWLQKQHEKSLTFKEKIAIIEQIAVFVRHLHQQQFRYGCLYTKHVFLHFEEKDKLSHVCVIDLEKVRKSFLTTDRLLRDLSQLYRSQENISRLDAMRFMKYYWNTASLEDKHKTIVRRLISYIERKRK